MELISVVIPCYNAEKTIKKCLKSIKKQSYENLEVIIVDDGSKDNSKNIVKKNIIDDKRFKYFYKKNGGLSSARNFGINKANGTFISFIDSDDYIEKDYIKLLYEDIKKNNSDISICSFNRIYDNSINVNNINDSYDMLKYPAAWNKLYKISLFKEKNIFFPVGKWYEDLCVFAKLFMCTKSISTVDKPLYNYIFSSNSTSIMHTYDERIYQIYDVVDDIEKFSKENGLYNNNIKEIEFIYVYHVIIGTVYRSSFLKDFNKNTIIKIVNFVNDKYPNWYKNKGIKKLSILYKIYLFMIRKRMFSLVYILLKFLNNKIKL